MITIILTIEEFMAIYIGLSFAVTEAKKAHDDHAAKQFAEGLEAIIREKKKRQS